MVPIADLVTIAPDATPADVESLVARTGFSRFPVASPGVGADGEARPRVVGYLHLKDVLYAHGPERATPVPGWRGSSLTAGAAGPSSEGANCGGGGCCSA